MLIFLKVLISFNFLWKWKTSCFAGNSSVFLHYLASYEFFDSLILRYMFRCIWLYLCMFFLLSFLSSIILKISDIIHVFLGTLCIFWYFFHGIMDTVFHDPSLVSSSLLLLNLMCLSSSSLNISRFSKSLREEILYILILFLFATRFTLNFGILSRGLWFEPMSALEYSINIVFISFTYINK